MKGVSATFNHHVLISQPDRGKFGGHFQLLFEEIQSPDRLMPDGLTHWLTYYEAIQNYEA